MRPSPVALNPTPSNTLKPQSPETPKPLDPAALDLELASDLPRTSLLELGTETLRKD